MDARPQLSDSDAERVLAVAAPALMPMLKRRQQECLNRLVGEYKNGNTDLRHIIAEYSAHTDLVRELEFKLTKYNRGV